MSPLSTYLLRGCGFLKRFRKDRDGATAIEFALLAPLMVSLLLCTIELTSGIIVNRKLAMVTRTVADLAARSDGLIPSAEMTNILTAGQTVVAPHSETPLKIVLSSIVISNAGVAKVAWSTGTTGAAIRTRGDTMTLDPVLKVANTSLIYAEITYVYSPPFGVMLAKNGFTMREQLFMRPRAVDKVCYQDSNGTYCTPS